MGLVLAALQRRQGHVELSLAAAVSALVLVLTIAGCAANKPAGSSSPAAPGAAQAGTSANPALPRPASMERFRLFDVPDSAWVAFAHDTVLWGTLEGSDSTAHFTSLSRYDAPTHMSGQDPWLTALLRGHYVDAWSLAGDTVAWCDTTKRIKRAGGGVLLRTCIEIARRPSTTPTVLNTSWGVGSADGSHDAGARLDGFNGRLCVFHTDAALRPSGTSLHPGPGAGEWAIDTLTGRRLRINAPVDGVLAMTGDTAYMIAGTYRASDFGSRDIWVCSPGRAARHLLAPIRATLPGAADATTLAFTSTPPGATDDIDEDLWTFSARTGRFRPISQAPYGQLAAAVGHGFVVWVDERRTHAGVSVTDLYGYDLVHKHQFVIALSPVDEDWPSNVTLCADEIFWTFSGHGGGHTVCGARLVRNGDLVRVERL
jgi:hypothetical protein